MNAKVKKLKKKLERVDEILEDEDMEEYGASSLGDGSYDTTCLVTYELHDEEDLGDEYISISDGYGDRWDVTDLSPREIVKKMKEYARSSLEN